MKDWRWKLAKIGFKLLKPWIVQQTEIDGGTDQVEEIMIEKARDMATEAHAWL